MFLTWKFLHIVGVVGFVAAHGTSASVALRLQAPNALAAGIAGVFAFFHGLAHGTEMAAGSSNIGYSAGLLMASAFVIAVAIAAERALASNARLARLGGGVAAVAGLAMMGGSI